MFTIPRYKVKFQIDDGTTPVQEFIVAEDKVLTVVEVLMSNKAIFIEIGKSNPADLQATREMDALN